MAINPYLSSLVLPFGKEFPGQYQTLVDELAQYLAIEGLDAFDGIVIGSTTPDSTNRDKPWYRINGSGVPMGWYVWNGSAWALLPAMFSTGTEVQRDAIASPLTGQSFFATDTLKLYVYSGSAWVPCVPDQARYHYDTSYTYGTQQLLATTANLIESWSTIDLSPYITELGLDAENSKGSKKYAIKAAIIHLTASMGPSPFTTNTWEFWLKCAGTNAVSVSTSGFLEIGVKCSANDSQASASNNVVGPVIPDADNNVYYCVTGTATTGLGAKVWLQGFVYTTTDAYFDDNYEE